MDLYGWIVLMFYLLVYLLTIALVALVIVRWLTGNDDAPWNPSEVGAAVVGGTFGGVTAFLYLILRGLPGDPDSWWYYFTYVSFGCFVGALLGAWGWYRTRA